VPEAIFTRDGDGFLPTELARGPWDPEALHGGAPAALLTRALEELHRDDGRHLGRLTFEFLRPVPMASLSVHTELLRSGRRAQRLGASLWAGDTEVCRVSALRLAPTPATVDPDLDGARLPAGQSEGRPLLFSLSGRDELSFAASAMEMRFVAGDVSPGPATVWMRLRHPLLAGEQPSPTVRTVAAADFGNGVSAALDFERFVFINPDLTVYLHRAPVGEWVCLDAHTRLGAAGGAVAQSALYDEQGPVGVAVQALVVTNRG